MTYPSPDRVLLECIEQHPGIHFRDAARRTGLTIGTAHEHLSGLERRDLVEALVDGRYKRYFVRSTVPSRELAILMALRGERTRQILVHLLVASSATQRELAAAVGVTRSAVASTLRSLADRGLVVGRRERRENHYRLVDPELARETLERLRESLG